MNIRVYGPGGNIKRSVVKAVAAAKIGVGANTDPPAVTLSIKAVREDGGLVHEASAFMQLTPQEAERLRDDITRRLAWLAEQPESEMTP